jgi:hypothetical protein
MTLSPEITIDPNPAVEGQPVVITVAGSGPWYVGRDGSGSVTEVTPTNGEIELLAPPGTAGQTFTVTDFGSPPTSAPFSIVAPQP